MRVLIVGGGGREHAIAWKVAQSPRLTQLYCLPGNPGIAALATCLPGSATDLAAVVAAVEQYDIDLTIVGPEEPLCLGLVDALTARGRRVFGPTAAAAAIEGSKAFAKQLMLKHGIPTASYQVFDELKPALDFIATCPLPVVIKADGIAAGKGVVIARERHEAQTAAREMLSGASFGDAGRRVVIEQFLTGPEVSVLALCAGRDFVLLPPAQDHKRAFAGDQGPNTGGMGTYSPLPFCPPEMLARIGETIFRPTLAALADAGRPFTGVLFAGLMLTANGPKVIEFNCRFGDPETQVVLRRLESDLLAGIEACLGGTLKAWKPVVSPAAAACIVLASGGYPGTYRRGVAISGLDAAAALPDVTVFHAGTTTLGGRTVTAGGRVLGVTATGADVRAALERAYAAADLIDFDGKQLRRDIGHQALGRV